MTVQRDYLQVHKKEISCLAQEEVARLKQILLQQLLRIHLEVEQYHIASFLPRAIRLRPRELEQAVASLNDSPSTAIAAQEQFPLGIFSPALWADDLLSDAAKALATDKDLLADWNNDPLLQFKEADRFQSNWKKSKEKDLNDLVEQYMKHHGYKKARRREVTALVIVQWQRVHLDVERLHPDSFANRVLPLTLEQLEETKQWLIVNSKSDFLKKALITPDPPEDNEDS